ncbi:uncharacterized protein LOC136025319 [Artemia franciscana]|uniref:Uncharacterized protein n=1 Tax=Artemia franciscana TaxID=6661 RepID=A0AA88HRN8_ARTSF|nr:hypothetical protein QYM36_011358 [Artemia franciscana]
MSLLFSDRATIQRPSWAIENQVRVPVSSTRTFRFLAVGNFGFIFRMSFLLEHLFTRKNTKQARSFEEDQLAIFKSLELSLTSRGIDGRACLLRSICELQKYPIGHMSLAGEILTILLTPKRGKRDFLHSYLDAQKLGQMENSTLITCEDHYSKCPVSLLNLLKSWSEAKSAIPNKREVREDGEDNPCQRGTEVPIEYSYLMHSD